MRTASLFIGSAALLATPWAGAETPTAKRPPNIVLILVDDMGWKDIAASGSKYYRTPAIDRLADEGVRFTRGYAPAAVCSPSRAAILTGQNPARLHVTDWIPGESAPRGARHRLPEWAKSLDPAIPTLPALLRERGYATASVGKWHLGSISPVAYGFDVAIAGGQTGQPLSYFWPYGKPGKAHSVPGLADTGGKPGEYLTDRLTDEALDFIGKNRAKPFFLYLPHYAVHGPLGAKPEDIESFKNTPPDGEQKHPLYAAMVKSVDESVGRINDRIKQLGLADDTVIIFTSDNGGVTHYPGYTSVKPLRGQKGFPYEGGVRTPFIIKAPGLAKPGLVSDARVIATDLAPTLLRLAGVSKTLPHPDGRDISPLLRGEAPAAPREFLFHYPHYWAGGLISPYDALLDGDRKIVRWHEYGTEEVYDLAKDPLEQHDLAAENPELRKTLAAKLDARLAAEGAQPPVLRPDAGPAPAKPNPAHAKHFLGGE